MSVEQELLAARWAAALNVIRHLQWSGSEAVYRDGRMQILNHQCPQCGQFQEEGHDPDGCVIGDFLADIGVQGELYQAALEYTKHLFLMAPAAQPEYEVWWAELERLDLQYRAAAAAVQARAHSASRNEGESMGISALPRPHRHVWVAAKTRSPEGYYVDSMPSCIDCGQLLRLERLLMLEQVAVNAQRVVDDAACDFDQHGRCQQHGYEIADELGSCQMSDLITSLDILNGQVRPE